MFAVEDGLVQAQSLSVQADTLTVPSSGLVFHPSQTLLVNDETAEDSVQVMVVVPPSHGTLTALSNGFFRYEPLAGFLGEDRFSYAIETVPLQRLMIDPTVSVLSFDATVQTALGTADDDEEIPVEGAIVVNLGDDPAGIDSVHVVDVSMQNQGSHSLNFNYGSPISIGSLRIIADPGAVQLAIVTPGPTSGVSGLLNSWEQVDNLVNVSVTAMLEGGGLITNQVPDTPQELETETTEALTGAVIISGGQVLFLMNVASTNAFQLEGNDVTLAIDGSLQAAGAFVAKQTSGEAVVILQVVSGASTEDVWARSGFGLDIYPQPVRDHFTLTIASGDATGRTVDLRVYDVLGRVVAEHSVTGSFGEGEISTRLDASNWAPGLYVVHVVGSTKSATRTFVRR